ncbi:MAG: aminopeptidase [Erysipelotrichaceae bacterium]|nr:aminopeptidase [Erysipelotrichaceae bacterium]
MNKWQLEKLARVLIRTGVNLQEGETVLLQTDTAAIDLAREITREAFEAGAADVEAFIDDAEINHLKALNCTPEKLKELPEWKKESFDSILRTGKGVQLGVRASRPSLNMDVPNENLKAQFYAANELRNVVRHYIHQGCLKWTGTVYPSMEWAKKVFPEFDDETAYAKLEEAICKMMRVDEDSDPVENWKKHCEELAARSKKLNDLNFRSLHVTSELGTDLKMDLVEDHIWCSAGEMGSQNVNAPYVANMPTEEVFTDPDFRSVNGIAYASFPLFISGKLVKDFSITFENGKAVDCNASENVEFLREALFRDETTRQLGEVALVSKKSPIRQMGRIFYNGLIDENAACHLAFGTSFPDCVKNGTDLSKEELLAKGVNFSVSHNDFMIGTDDIKVVGTTHDGKQVTIMKHGDFVL